MMSISNRVTKASVLALSISVFMALGCMTARAESINLVGLNLSGAGFAPQVLPGVNGTNYIFPVENYFQQWSARGIKLIRFPIIWERLQPNLGGALDPTYAALIDQTFSYANKHGIQIILDLHNYARYRGQIIGAGSVTYEQYQDVMTRIAQRWSGQSSLYAYDIMNEPNGALSYWPTAAQYGINGIRTVDRTRPIIVEGNGWAEATRWAQWNEPLLKLVDPSNNIIFSAHTYFDANAGGNYNSIDVSTLDPMYGVERVKPFIEWLKKHGKRGYIGEFGVPDNDARWFTIMDNMLAYLKQNCIPATYWAAGPGWGNYFMSVEPVNGQDRPQWPTLKKYVDNTSCTGIGPLTTPSSTDDGNSVTVTPTQSQVNAVQLAYQYYLGRDADAAGLQGWASRLANGSMTIESITAAIKQSQEYQTRSAVQQMYINYLGREADAGGLAEWTNYILSGKITLEAAANAFTQSNEYKARSTEVVKQIYRDYLGREADQEGLAGWAGRIADGSMSIDAVVSVIKQSDEYQVRNAVQQLYMTYLGRAADSGGLINWSNQVLSGNMSIEAVANALVQSQEYKDKSR
ncbi:cellulase family glycosylhydrolase [Pseudomonas luteola]